MNSEIANLIPHSGNMCLLDNIISITDTTISCSSNSHLKPNNPLRLDNKLNIYHGIEYAAQAAALHIAKINTTAETKPKLGFLTTVKNIISFTNNLDDYPDKLIITASCKTQTSQAAIYEFEINCQTHKLLTGRFSIMQASGASV